MDAEGSAPLRSAAAFLDSVPEHSSTLGLRRSTVEAALQWLLDHGPPRDLQIVETGTYSGAHALYHSTALFAELCRRAGGRVRTVDIDPERVAAARRLMEPLAPWIEFACSDSVRWLRDLRRPVHLLHLDSWDYLGSRWNRFRSRLHCWRELRAAYSRLASEAVVLVDDQHMDRAWWPGADYRAGERGKGAFAVPWLRRRGWRVLAEEYQVALVRA